MIAKTSDPIAFAHPVTVAGIPCASSPAPIPCFGETLLTTPNSREDSEPGLLAPASNKPFSDRGELKHRLARDRFVAIQNPRNRSPVS